MQISFLTGFPIFLDGLNLTSLASGPSPWILEQFQQSILDFNGPFH